MNTTNIQDVQIDKTINMVYEEVVRICNKILQHANILGFSLMHVPDPSIHSFIVFLEGVAVPLLDKLIASGDLSPTSGIKIANVKQYNFHIRAIVLALEQDDREAFNKAVSLLQNESMLFCD